MARREVVECDKCGREGRTFVLWVDGDAAAQRVDLCDTHSRSLLVTFAGGSVVDLPVKPRARMEATPLRVTDKTRRFKK